MPKLKQVQAVVREIDIGSETFVNAVSNVLAGRSKAHDQQRFARVVRSWFAQKPSARQEFIEWYEDVPAAGGSADEDRPRKKKKKKRTEDEGDDE